MHSFEDNHSMTAFTFHKRGTRNNSAIQNAIVMK